MGIVELTRTTEGKVIWKRQHQVESAAMRKGQANKTELQIEAPTEETRKRRQEQLRKTDELVTSAIGLRGRGLFFFYQEKVTGRATTGIVIEWRTDLWSEPRRVPESPRRSQSPNTFLSRLPTVPRNFHSTDSIRCEGLLSKAMAIAQKNGKKRRKTFSYSLRTICTYAATIWQMPGTWYCTKLDFTRYMKKR